MSRTIRFHKFGSAEVLKCEEHEVAAPASDEVQVRVQAIGISWYDVLWRQNLAPSQARLPAGLGHGADARLRTYPVGQGRVEQLDEEISYILAYPFVKQGAEEVSPLFR